MPLRTASCLAIILSLLPAHAGNAGSLTVMTLDEPIARHVGAQQLRKSEDELEAVALQILISPMFPSGGAGLFGTGAAGKYWQAMLSEQIARQIAAGGQLRLLPKSSGGVAQGLLGQRALSTSRGGCGLIQCKGGGPPTLSWQATVLLPGVGTVADGANSSVRRAPTENRR